MAVVYHFYSMKNIIRWVYRWCTYLFSTILFSPDIFSKTLSHPTLETFTQHARRYPNKGLHTLPNTEILYYYRDPFVRSALHAAKYRDRKDVCNIFGELLWDTYGEALSYQSILAGKPWLVIPIPTSSRHRRERGYNQTEEIAKGFLTHADTSVYALSTKSLCMAASHTHQTQTKKKKERIQNIRGSFNVSDTKLVYGQQILLIDDVVTTGATLQEATRVLYAAGVHHIQCLVIAH